jgi:hypothetical protein
MLSSAETIGTIPDGRPVQAWRLGDPKGVEPTVMDYGARAVSLRVPVRSGQREILLTFDGLAAWLADRTHIGAIAGRYANRIAGAASRSTGGECSSPPTAAPTTRTAARSASATRCGRGRPRVMRCCSRATARPATRISPARCSPVRSLASWSGASQRQGCLMACSVQSSRLCCSSSPVVCWFRSQTQARHKLVFPIRYSRSSSNVAAAVEPYATRPIIRDLITRRWSSTPGIHGRGDLFTSTT